MSTVLEILNLSLRQVRFLSYGQTADPQLRAVGVEVLNQMLAEWSGRRLVIPFTTWDTFTLTANKAEYSIGASAADVTDVRPEYIDRAFIRDAGDEDHRVEVVDEARYMQFASKGSTGRPSVLWYNPTVPNGTLLLYPTVATAEAIHYSHLQAFPEPADEDATLVVPRSMDPIIMWNMCVRLADMLPGIELTAVQAKMAEESLNRLITLNAVRRAKPVTMDIIDTTEVVEQSEGMAGAIAALGLE